MSETNHLWEYTIAEILKHDLKSELGLVIREWVKFNKLGNFNTLLYCTIDDFSPSCNLCHINENREILHQTSLKEYFNLRWYIQDPIDESEHEFEDPLSEDNWVKQTTWKFIKYVIQHKHSLTPEQFEKGNISKKLSGLDMNNLI